TRNRAEEHVRSMSAHWAGLSALVALIALAFVGSIVANGADPRSRKYDHAAPRPLAEAMPSFGTAPLRVRLDGSASTDDVGITDYRWTFDDGTTGNGQISDHVYETAGVFHPRLEVVDAAGHSRKTILTIEVHAPSDDHLPPVARMAASLTEGTAP